MTNDKLQILNSCKEDPSLIFTYIKQENFDVVEEMLSDNIVNINVVDSVGNDVMTRLLKAKQYELVLLFMKKRNWNVNHQNIDGNTFGHVLATDNSIMAVKVVEQLTKKSNYLPNIKNNKGYTAMDLALSNNYLCTAFKLLEDKRFDNISLFSFKHLINVIMRNGVYGKYSKITNLEIVVESMEKKELDSELKRLVNYISDNMEAIKYDIMNGRIAIIDKIVNSTL